MYNVLLAGLVHNGDVVKGPPAHRRGEMGADKVYGGTEFEKRNAKKMLNIIKETKRKKKEEVTANRSRSGMFLISNNNVEDANEKRNAWYWKY